MRSLAPGLCLAAIAFFAHSTLFDPHGARRLAGLEAKLAERQAVLETRKAERLRREMDVRLLGPDRIDPDVLDERARAALGLARPDEIVIFNPN